MEGKAVNVIKFNVRGLNLLNGQLTIEASFKIASKSVKASILFCYFVSNSFFLFKVAIKLLVSFKRLLFSILQRVDISYDNSTITPEQVSSPLSTTNSYKCISYIFLQLQIILYKLCASMGILCHTHKVFWVIIKALHSLYMCFASLTLNSFIFLFGKQ